VPTEPLFMSPATVDDAVAAMAREDAVLVAGGTSVGLLVSQRLLEPSALVWLGRIAELRGIASEGGRIVIGAGTTLREVAAHPAIVSSLPAVSAAADEVGNIRVRAVATVGGALAHADPRQDLPPALLACDAEVHVVGSDSSRWLPLRDLAIGFMSTVLAQDEIITAISVPLVANQRSYYCRFTPGSADDYPCVAVAASICTDGKTVTAARIAVGGAGPVAYLVDEAESLVGTSAQPSAVTDVARAAASRAAPMDDRLGSASYKRAMVAVWVERALAQCRGSSGQH
jgi:aerobic carbon-monoxide dehydrogenase medium subunit